MGRLKVYPDLGIVQRLDEVMTQHGSDSQWGARLECDRKTVLAYRHGDTDIPATRLKRICLITGVNAQWLIFGEGEKYE